MRATTLPTQHSFPSKTRKADPYLLPRDEFEKKRLNLQQTVIARSFDNQLLAPGVRLEENDRILDMGCGTGIWGIELSSTIPRSIRIDSCDLSDKNFLDVKALGIDNINFCTHSVLELPQEWTDQFTVVHQRLMHASFRVEEWRYVLQELRRIVKPGGWLQLVEIDLSSFYNDGLDNIHTSPVPAQAELNALWKETVVNADMTWELEATLPGYLKDAGFENVEWTSKIFSTEGAVYPRPENSSLADDTLACMVDVMKSSKSNIVALGKIDGQRFDELIEGMSNGWKDLPKTENGRGWKWHMVSAQKPLH
jgi:ubiquinone/menaquinone biosynthesis C-methylase UbiE